MLGLLLNLGFAGGAPDGCFESDVYELSVLEETGPGTPSKWIEPVAAGVDRFEDRTAYLDTTTLFTLPTTVGGQARMLMFGFAGSNYAGSYNLLDGTTSTTGSPLIGPSALGLWTTAPWANPQFGTLTSVWPNGAARDYALGAKWEQSKKGVDDLAGLVRGSYTIAYQLWDSRTGRKSNLSELKEFKVEALGRVAAIENAYQGTTWIQENTNTPPYSDVSGTWVNGHLFVTFMALDLVYDRTKWDSVRIYRTLRYETQGIASYVETQILRLEADVALEDYHTLSQPGDTDWKRAVYFFTRTDKELATQPTWQGEFFYEPEMPHAGAGIFQEGVMFLGNIQQNNAEFGSLGLVKWSDPREAGVELVTPYARYVLKNPTEQVLAFQEVGPAVFGLGDENIYMFRKDGAFIVGYPAHRNFGLVNNLATEVVGSLCYFVTPQGLKVLSSDGAMGDITSVEGYIKNDWKTNLDTIQLAYDGEAGVLIMHNPTLEQSVLLWLENGKQTSLHDAAFDYVASGLVELDDDQELHQRAVFVHKTAGTGSGPIWHVNTLDYERSKSTIGRMLDYAGDSIVEVSNVFGNAVGISSSYVSPSQELVGGYAYVWAGTVDGASVAGYGLKMKVVGVIANFVQLDQDDIDAVLTAVGLDPETDDLSDIDGLMLAWSPVYFRWTGAAPQVGDDQGYVFSGRDRFRIRQIRHIRCAWTDVAGDAASSTDAHYWGQVFKDNGATPISRTRPLNTDGTVAVSLDDTNGPGKFVSKQGENGVTGAALFPSVEVFTPDLDFTLLEVEIQGTITGWTRESIPGV